ncbi:MAG: TRAM domain-containing protein [Demequina sp.]
MTTVRLTVESVAHGGHCIARHEGRVIFVRHALPGEVVEAVVTEQAEAAPYWRADAVTIVEPSEDRVPSAWPAAGPGGVGGAELAHVALDAQRQWKLTVLQDSFTRFAHRDFPGGIHAAPGDDERGGLRWRTRVNAVTDAQGRAAMHAPRSTAIQVLEDMPLAVERAERALIGERFAAHAQVAVVAPAGTDHLQVVVDGTPWRAGKKDHRSNAPAHVSESVTVGDTDYHYRVATTGFWQVHREAPAVLVGEVLARVGQAETVADLYAGAGLFSLPLADAGKRVTMIESHPLAAKAARRNLHVHPDATVIEGDVRRSLKSGIGHHDVVVLDPPRSGVGHATIDALMDVQAPRLVYVACDPVALARDTGLLAERGYDLVGASAWDLFPMTHHMEAVATFQRR